MFVEYYYDIQYKYSTKINQNLAYMAVLVYELLFYFTQNIKENNEKRLKFLSVYETKGAWKGFSETRGACNATEDMFKGSKYHTTGLTWPFEVQSCKLWNSNHRKPGNI